MYNKSRGLIFFEHPKHCVRIGLKSIEIDTVENSNNYANSRIPLGWIVNNGDIAYFHANVGNVFISGHSLLFFYWTSFKDSHFSMFRLSYYPRTKQQVV